jgi:hypothetical protein
MKRFEKAYNKLRETLTDEEIADAMLLPADLTEEEAERVNKEIRDFRFKLLASMTEEQRIYADLLRFRYQTETYLKQKSYQPAMKFGSRLDEYTRILNRTKKEIAADLGIHYTKFSRIINSRETPNLALMYRLEIHSGNLIPALFWWKLLMKEKAFEIVNDTETKKIESAKVKNALSYSVE